MNSFDVRTRVLPPWSPTGQRRQFLFRFGVPALWLAALLCFSALVLLPAARGQLTLRVGVALPPGNPSAGLSAIAEALSSEALVGLAADGKPVPSLALSWTRSSDQKDWTFTLPEKIQLHDGSSADASTIAELVKQAIARPITLRFHPHLAHFYEVRSDGARSLLMRSHSARLLALEELANVSLRTGKDDGGLGPFVVEAITPDRVQLRAFRNYFNGAPALEQVEFRSFRTQRSAWAAMMRNEIDALYEVNREAVEFVERESRVRVYRFRRPYVAALLFNVTRPPLKSVTVRRAITAAIDRAEIVDTAFRGRAQLAYGPLWPEYWALPSDAPQQRHDPALAKRLLAEVPNTARSLPTGSRLRFRCLVPAFETQPFERVALTIQRQLYELGIDMELESVSVAELMGRLPSGQFDAVLLEFLGLTPSWIHYFWHSQNPDAGGLNTGYSAADAELDALNFARDENELRTALRGVYARFVEDPPAVFLAWPEVARAVSRRYEVPLEAGRDIMGINLRLWRPAQESRESP